jgi:MoaA/NifB/PqqE/SkfB family radical SAM enzyme
MNFLQRAVRYARISGKGLSSTGDYGPPILILFISSVCNLRCEHCVYWKKLNRRDDLTTEEILSLSNELGRLEILALSGGEPFLRDRFGDICRSFILRNQVEQIYVPTNGYFTKRIIASIRDVLREKSLKLFVIEISLDGTQEFHNKFRGAKRSFQQAMETYKALAELQKEDPRLRIHAISTATEENLDEIRKLTTYLYSKCEAIDHHNIALIRGDRKNPSLHGPELVAYEKLVEYTRRLWAPREEARYGSIVEPMLQWAKVHTLRKQRQVIPCMAGRINAVVYANGDVGICEFHKPIGNLKQKGFMEIWKSKAAKELRRSISRKECYCSNEVFLWPSIVFQPVYLAYAMLRAKVWKKPEPLTSVEACDCISVDSAQEEKR